MDLHDATIEQMRKDAKAQREAELEAKHKFEQSRPAIRLAPDEQAEMLEAQKRNQQQNLSEPAPEPVNEPKTPADIAERMTAQPAGYQRPPSPGGKNYVNPLAYRPVYQKSSGNEGLVDQVERELKEARAHMTPEDKEIERLESERLDREMQNRWQSHGRS